MREETKSKVKKKQKWKGQRLAKGPAKKEWETEKIIIIMMERQELLAGSL